MNFSNWIRQIHRWLSIAFTAGFVLNLVVVFRAQKETVWIGLTALLPLLLLLATGLYMFVLPYWRRSGITAANAKS